MSKKSVCPPLLENNEKNSSLRERVYTYLTEGMATGKLHYGKYIDQSAICRELSISKAPLRDALIRLEAEGFVTILPNRGVFIKPLTIDVIKAAYQIIGALEADCIDKNFHKFTSEHIKQLEESNELQRLFLETERYKEYYSENIYFHNIFISLAENVLIDEVLIPLRRRLYDFPRRSYSLEWENVHLEEHRRFIESLKKGNRIAAVSIFRDEHWSFEVHKKYFSTYYTFDYVNDKDRNSSIYL